MESSRYPLDTPSQYSTFRNDQENLVVRIPQLGAKEGILTTKSEKSTIVAKSAFFKKISCLS